MRLSPNDQALLIRSGAAPRGYVPGSVRMPASTSFASEYAAGQRAACALLGRSIPPQAEDIHIGPVDRCHRLDVAEAERAAESTRALLAKSGGVVFGR